MALCPPPPFAPLTPHTLRALLVQEVRASGALPTHFAIYPAQLHHALLFQVLDIALGVPMCVLLGSITIMAEAP